jgi:gas vesicle protein
MERDQTGRFLPRRSSTTTSNPGREPSFEQTSRPWQPQGSFGGYGEEEPMRRSGVGTALGVVAGAGIGAVLMFLLDPDQGRRRREQLADLAAEAMEKTTDTVSHAWEAGSEKALGAGSALYAAAPSRRGMRKSGRRMLGGASSAFGSTRDTASDWLESARSHLPGYRRSRGMQRYLPEVPSQVSTSTAGISAAGALALGLGAMWLFDPGKGRARRAWIGQKATRVLNETGSFMRATGRHMANKSKGYYYEGRKAVGGAGQAISDSAIAERVRSAIGRVGVRGSSSVAVQSLGGVVTLTGRCVADDLDQVILVTRETFGVNDVINQMQIGDRFENPTSGAPTGI